MLLIYLQDDNDWYLKNIYLVPQSKQNYTSKNIKQGFKISVINVEPQWLILNPRFIFRDEHVESAV